MSEEKRAYKAYLLRVWESSDKGKRLWRASVESPGTGERRGFASLEALFAFLKEQTGSAPRRGGENNTP
ncbi:MAG: hypothetical protein JSV81_11895 [Anaerolineales bacterium]|nr:MAG: hypothetical protein JSV81_11895 [Anaerolineales bacterium]